MVTKDLNARKEAVMASVRNELALANAQELINVRAKLSLYTRRTSAHSFGGRTIGHYRKQTTNVSRNA